jgi:ABC-type sugar transport system ATPase subunit
MDAALEGVTKVYPGGVRALDGLTLRADDGQMLVLVGPSGCGKTTALRLLAGLERPTAGAVFLGGRPMTGVPPHRRDVALAFQRPALYPQLTVRQNLRFGLELRHPPLWRRLLSRLSGGGEARRDAEERRRVAEVAELLRLTDVLERSPAQLSGGQQQRAALGRALVRRPALLLLDEPFANLDARLRQEMRAELHLLRGRLRATMIYVTHDQEEALALGDQVAVLHRGALQQAGRPLDLYRRPANRFVAEFLGWPPLIALDGALAARDGSLWFDGPFGPWPAPAGRDDWAAAAGRRVTLGLRPEQVRLGSSSGAEVRIAMEVRLVERLGASDLVTLGRGDWTVTLRRPADTLSSGEAVELGLPLAGALLFDAADGRTLSHARPEG